MIPPSPEDLFKFGASAANSLFKRVIVIGIIVVVVCLVGGILIGRMLYY